MWNTIYRGGVQRTTPETREANAPTSGTFLPGTIVGLSGATIAKGAAAGANWYALGEQMHGTVDENQVGLQSSVRMFQPHSGDLLCARAVAGVALVDDLALTVDADGRVKAANGTTDPVVAYVDQPAGAFPKSVTPTTLDQLIPIKIK